MKNILLLTIVVLLIVSGLGWYLKGQAAPTSGTNSPPAGVHAIGVHALGRLEPAGTVLRISAPSGNEGGCLAELLVEEGSDVAQGQVLARMDTYARRVTAVAEARARLLAGEAQLVKILAGNKQGEIDAARAAVQLAEAEVETKERHWIRAQQLRKRAAITIAESDDARLAFQRAGRTLEQAKATLAALCEVRQVDVKAQEAEIAVSESVLATAQANLDASEVRAPRPSRVLKIYTRPGEQPDQKGILELGQIGHMQAVAEVFEGDIPQVVHGQSAIVEVDTTGYRLQGRVVEIGNIVARKAVLTNDPVSDTDARVVEVRIDIDGTSMALVSRLSNARVQVQIDTSVNRVADVSLVQGKRDE